MNIAVIGGGRWGCTLAMLLCWLHHKVTLFCLQEDLEALTTNRVVPTTRIPLSKAVKLSMNKAALTECEVVFIAVPGQHLKETWEMWGYFIHGTVVVAVKSIDERDGKLVLPLDTIEHDATVYFGCAGFPQGLLRKSPSPAQATAYSHSEESAMMVQGLFNPYAIRSYRSQDMLGGQLGSAYKNVLAIGCGIARGMGFSEETTSTLISRGIAEIQRFGVSQGARPETFGSGSTVLTDLIMTCTSKHSHNLGYGRQRVREMLKGIPIENIGTVEGVRTVEMMARAGLLSDLPIGEAVHAVIHGGDPREAARNLLGRELKKE